MPMAHWVVIQDDLNRQCWEQTSILETKTKSFFHINCRRKEKNNDTHNVNWRHTAAWQTTKTLFQLTATHCQVVGVLTDQHQFRKNGGNCVWMCWTMDYWECSEHEEYSLTDACCWMVCSRRATCASLERSSTSCPVVSSSSCVDWRGRYTHTQSNATQCE